MYNNPVVKDHEIYERKNELTKSRLKEISTVWEDKKVKFIDDISETFKRMNKVTGSPCYTQVKYLLLN